VTNNILNVYNIQIIMVDTSKLKDSEISNNKIYILSKENSYTFDKSGYKEEFLDKIMSKKEYEEIVLELTKLMGKAIGRKRTTDKISFPGFLKVSTIISLLFAVGYIICIFLSQKSPNPKFYLVIGIILLCISIIMLFALSIYNFCRQPDVFIPLDQLIEEAITKYTQQLDEKYNPKLTFTYYLKNKVHNVEITIKRFNESFGFIARDNKEEDLLNKENEPKKGELVAEFKSPNRTRKDDQDDDEFAADNSKAAVVSKIKRKDNRNEIQNINNTKGDFEFGDDTINKLDSTARVKLKNNYGINDNSMTNEKKEIKKVETKEIELASVYSNATKQVSNFKVKKKKK